MALDVNAQYTRFVQFAEQQMDAGNEESVARDGGAHGGHEIRAADTDKRWSLVRNLATGAKYEGLHIEFNPEYEA